MQSFSVIIGNPVILWNHLRTYLNVQGTVYPTTTLHHTTIDLANNWNKIIKPSNYVCTIKSFPTCHFQGLPHSPSYTHSTVHPGLVLIALGDSPYDDSVTLRMLDRCTSVRMQLLHMRKETQDGDNKYTNMVINMYYVCMCLISHIR